MPGLGQVLGKINRGHSTATELVLDLVAVSQCGFQVFQALGHGELRWVKQRKLEREWLSPNFVPPNAYIP